MNYDSSPFSQHGTMAPSATSLLVGAPSSGRGRGLTLTSARSQLLRVATVTGVGFLAHLFTWGTDGWGLNVVLVAGVYLALACGHTFGWRPSRRWGKVSLSVRVQLTVWVALAVASLWHFDPWTVTTFLLSTLTVLTAVVVGPGLDPVSLFVRSLIRVAGGPLVTLHFAYRSGQAVQRRLRARHPSLSRTLLPVLAVLTVASLYILSNSWLSGLWVRFEGLLARWTLGGEFMLHLVFILAWAAGGVGIFYRMGYVERWCSRSIWGLSPKPATAAAAATAKQVDPGDRVAVDASGSVEEVASDMARRTSASDEWSPASVTLVCVNALAVLLNAADAFTTWFGERSTNGEELKHGLHQGTWALSTAVVLAAAALCYLLANPASDQQRARTLGLAWLGQNVMMVFTVALRNYHYTDAFGMTYKRLGVYLFLVCTLVGLYLLTRTVLERTSVAGLVHRQAWATYYVLAFAALINWPSAFTWYNLQAGRQERDLAYLEHMLPYNLATWHALDRPYVTGCMSATASYTDWHLGARPIRDWRDWDLAQARRNKIMRAIEGGLDNQTTRRH